MSFTDVLASSGAARGAIYHHFPGGKAQLVAEAAQRNGADVRAHLAALPASSPREVVEAFFAAIRPVLSASTAGAGSAVAAVTVGTAPGRDPGDEELRRVAATTFSSWTQALSDRLTTAGLPPGQAADLAVTLITLLEGAHVLCRAAGTLDPLDHVVRAAASLVPGTPE
jgi:TetR/AcrR family transcriptional regulator, lmrAB and yxaGH operons repressor